MTSPYAPTPEAPAPPRRPSWVVPLLVAVALIVLAAAGVTTWALTRTPDAPTTPPASAAGGTFAARGTLRLADGIGPAWPLGESCSGRGGYADIREGAQVTVTDSTGAVVALSELSDGVVTDNPELQGSKVCEFAFSLRDVPAGRGIYGVEVSHRGAVRFQEVDMFRDIGLTLG